MLAVGSTSAKYETRCFGGTSGFAVRKIAASLAIQVERVGAVGRLAVVEGLDALDCRVGGVPAHRAAGAGYAVAVSRGSVW